MLTGLQRIIMRDLEARILRRAADDLAKMAGECDQATAVEWLRERADRLDLR